MERRKKTEDFISEIIVEAGIDQKTADFIATKITARLNLVSGKFGEVTDRFRGAAEAFAERLKTGEVIDHPEYWAPRTIGASPDMVCLITGETEKFMPTLSGAAKSKNAALRIAKMFNGRAKVSNDQENVWIVKVGVLEKHKPVLGRLLDAVLTCECMLSPDMINWAADPVKFETDEPKALWRIRKLQEASTKPSGCGCFPVCKCD